jgi:hypothetical protein
MQEPTIFLVAPANHVANTVSRWEQSVCNSIDKLPITAQIATLFATEIICNLPEAVCVGAYAGASIWIYCGIPIDQLYLTIHTCTTASRIEVITLLIGITAGSALKFITFGSLTVTCMKGVQTFLDLCGLSLHWLRIWRQKRELYRIDGVHLLNMKDVEFQRILTAISGVE